MDDMCRNINHMHVVAKCSPFVCATGLLCLPYFCFLVTDKQRYNETRATWYRVSNQLTKLKFKCTHSSDLKKTPSSCLLANTFVQHLVVHIHRAKLWLELFFQIDRLHAWISTTAHPDFSPMLGTVLVIWLPATLDLLTWVNFDIFMVSKPQETIFVASN